MVRVPQYPLDCIINPAVNIINSAVNVFFQPYAIVTRIQVVIKFINKDNLNR